MLTVVPRQLRTSCLVGRLGSALGGDLILKQASSSLLASSFPNRLSVLHPQQSASASTYMHDDKLHNDKIFPKPRRWPQYNDVVHKPEDGPVERYYCHYRDNIKYSPKKMFYVASFVRGMSIDEAIKQLTYINLKGATVVKEVLKEAQEIAIAEHNFEYKSKMWIAESFCSKGLIMKGYRKHARMRFGVVHYYHTHYLVKLVEGDPPVGYGPAQGPIVENMTAEDRLSQHLEKLRKRRIDFAL